MSEFEFGQPVSFTHALRRRGRYATSTNRFGRELEQWRKEWTAEGYDGKLPPPEPRDGIVVGRRTLVNGDRDYIGYEEGYGFIPREYVTAYVVAFDMHRKPAYVLPEHMSPIAKEESSE